MRIERFILVAFLLVGAGIVAPGGSAWTMSACKDCPVYLSWVAVPSPFSVEGHRDIVSGFAVGEGAVVGPWAGRLTVTVEPLNQSAPPIVVEKNVTLNLSADDTRPGTALGSLGAGLDLGVGAYHVAVSFFNRQGGWDGYENDDVIIEGPTKLTNGTGAMAVQNVNSLDFAGDSRFDLWITRASDGRPANGSVTLRAFAWDGEALQGTTFSGHVMLEDGAGRHEVRIAGPALGAVFPGIDLRRLSIGVSPEENTWRWNAAGDLVMTVGNRGAESSSPWDSSSPQAPQTTDLSFEIMYKRAATRPPAHWPTGYRTMVNVSTWDVDEEGAPDVFFYHSSAARRSDAEATTIEQRRSTPIDLWMRLNVTERADGRLAEILVDRLSPPLSAGAWIELKNFASLFARLLNDDPERYGDEPQISLAMEPDEGFVSHEGRDVWLWVGHFSTQRFSVLLPVDRAPPDIDATPAGHFGVVLLIFCLLLAAIQRRTITK